ncbi:MAG: SDR family NAD(P)-dependent oxidoreductase [Arachnia sp.]
MTRPSPIRGPLSLLLIGGTSEIALTLATTLAERHELHVVLAARPGRRRDSADGMLTSLGCDVESIDFDAQELDRSLRGLGHLFDGLVVDVAVVAQGVLPDQDLLESNPQAAGRVCTINYTSAVGVGLLLADRMVGQGRGVIVALSSVAAMRPRNANYVYGSTKAGLDAFYTGLRDRLHDTAVRVLVVRPGHVHTRMTQGLTPAPFAVGPEAVADAIVARLDVAGDGPVWVPAILGPVMGILGLLPAALFRQLAGEPASQRPLGKQATR